MARINFIYFYFLLILLGATIILLSVTVVRKPLNLEYNLDNNTLEVCNKDLDEIENLIDETRRNLRSEFQRYDFTLSGHHQLEDVQFETGEQPLMTLFVSSWRSGSTFIAEILNSMPGTFYHYEPLWHYRTQSIRGPPYSKPALAIVQSMLKCNYNSREVENYFSYKRLYPRQLYHNTRLYELCKNSSQLCLDEQFTSRVCRIFPFQLMKEVRLRLKLVEELFRDKELNIKVILLIRDPRAVMLSRRKDHFCSSGPDCSEVELVCADMLSDYKAAKTFMQLYPGRMMTLRFEDLALDPYKTVDEIFDFIKIKQLPNVKQFLDEHTKRQVEGLRSTSRVSKEIAFKWIKMLNFTEVAEIQMSCHAMELWGYRMVKNAIHMTSEDFYPLGENKNEHAL